MLHHLIPYSVLVTVTCRHGGKKIEETLDFSSILSLSQRFFSFYFMLMDFFLARALALSCHSFQIISFLLLLFSQGFFHYLGPLPSPLDLLFAADGLAHCPYDGSSPHPSISFPFKKYRPLRGKSPRIWPSSPCAHPGAGVSALCQ